MRALVQRVSEARVRVDGVVIGEIDHGLCILVGVTHSDDEATARTLAEKVRLLRIFDDAAGVMNRSLADVGGAALVVSQFTLHGDTSKGRRPSWRDAAPGDHAEPLVEQFAATIRELGTEVAMGRFGADMQVELVNDGPVTLIVEA